MTESQKLLNSILSGARVLPSNDRDWHLLTFTVNGLRYHVQARQLRREGQSPRWDDDWEVKDSTIH